MFDFQAMKCGLFSERDNVDDAIEYASALAGNGGVTASMIMYNTVMQKLDNEQKKRESVRDHADDVLSVVLSCGRHIVRKKDYADVIEYLQESPFRTYLDFDDCGEHMDIVLRMDSFGANRMRVREIR